MAKRGAVPVPEARNEAMELEIERDLAHDDAFLVYADWLQTHGNPRGELVALDAAGQVEQAEELRERLLPQLLGPLASFAEALDIRWRCGFIDAMRVETTREDEDEGHDVVQRLDAALKLPSTRFLRELTIGCPSIHEDVMLYPALVAGGIRPTLRRLVFATNDDEEMLSWTVAGEVGALCRLYPELEELEVCAGRYSLTAPAFPKLRRLILQTCSIDPATIQTLIAADWPALEELELWFGSSSYNIEISIDQLRSILTTPFPKLRSLALSNGEQTDELCTAVLESPLLPQLSSLAIAKSTMTDMGAQRLVAGADRLRHLAMLDVDDNYLSKDALRRLRAALPLTRSNDQRVLDEGYDYYASIGE